MVQGLYDHLETVPSQYISERQCSIFKKSIFEPYFLRSIISNPTFLAHSLRDFASPPFPASSPAPRPNHVTTPGTNRLERRRFWNGKSIRVLSNQIHLSSRSMATTQFRYPAMRWVRIFSSKSTENSISMTVLADFGGTFERMRLEAFRSATKNGLVSNMNLSSNWPRRGIY